MKNNLKKLIALLMLLWLPLSSASALAATVSMQMHEMHDTCHDTTVPVAQHQTTGSHHAPTQHNAPCSVCGACHLACAGYLATQAQELALLQPGSQPVAAYPVSFTSVTTAPLDPPPIARS